MSKRRIVDTNLIVRYLVQDHPKHAKAATRLFESCDRGEVVVVLLPVVLAECVFVLESFYKHPRGKMAQVLVSLITSPGVDLETTPVYVDALRRYGKSKLHFVDCVIAAHAVAGDMPVATFDNDFSKFADVRIEME